MFARPGLPSFDYVRPAEPEEVVELLARHGAAARLLMGGTDLLVRLREGALRPRLVVDVKHLPGMQAIDYDPAVGLSVGAAVTMNRLADHPAVQAHYPLLAEAAQSVASYQLRNRATLGGNLANASPCADTAPATLVLAGQLVLFGPEGRRVVPAEDFFLGPGETVLGPAEFVSAARYPPPPAGAVGCYRKLGRNRGGDLSLVAVAAYGFPDDALPSGFRFRMALGAVAPTPLRAAAAEEILAARPPGAETFARAAERAAAEAAPIDDVRASAAYRRAMIISLTRRGLEQLWRQLQQGR